MLLRGVGVGRQCASVQALGPARSLQRRHEQVAGERTSVLKAAVKGGKSSLEGDVGVDEGKVHSSALTIFGATVAPSIRDG